MSDSRREIPATFSFSTVCQSVRSVYTSGGGKGRCEMDALKYLPLVVVALSIALSFAADRFGKRHAASGHFGFTH